MKREEAIKNVQSFIGQLTPMCQESIYALVPELRVGEDERIRKWIVNYIHHGAFNEEEHPMALKAIEWLEKQKVNTDGDFARGYDCGYECCLNSHGAEWIEKRKEQKPNPLCGSTEEYYREAYYDKPEKEPKTALRLVGDGLYSYPNAHFELESEQKPAEKQDYSGLSDLERAIHRGFLAAGVENVPVGVIKETAQECLVQMKPAEWTEEDEKKIVAIKTFIAQSKRFNRENMKKVFELIDALRSRPIKADNFPEKSERWKPGEEQMSVLLSAEGLVRANNSPENAKILASLYEDLKNLM